MLALSEANDDRRLEAQLRNARTVAGMRSSGSGTRAEPFVDAVRVLAQKGLDSGNYTSMEDALAAADAALRPYYGSGGGKLTMQETEKAAQTAGETEFTFGGNRYPVRD